LRLIEENPARAFRLSIGRDRFHHVWRGAGAFRPMVAPAHTLVQRLDPPCQWIFSS